MIQCRAKSAGVRLSLSAVLALTLLSAGCELIVSGETQKVREWRRETTRAVTAMSVDDFEQAHTTYKRALVIAESLRARNTKGSDYYVLTTLDKLAYTSGYMGHYAECEEYSRQSLGYRESFKEAERYRAATSLNMLASCLAQLGRFEEAKAAHTRLVELYKPRAEPHDEFLATSYREFGEALLDQGEAKAAIVQFEAALKVRLWALRSNRFDIAITYDRYAKALRELGRDAEAEVAEANAREILEGSDYYREIVIGHDDREQTWPEGPIRIYVTALRNKDYSKRAALRNATRRAILAWSEAARPGRPTFEFVDTRAKAQIEIRWVGNKGDLRWLGFTTTDWKPDWKRRRSTIEVATTRLGVEPPLEELYRVVLHEMGHALGLHGHSPYPRDIMYLATIDGGPSEISDRDRATLRMLY